MTDRELVAKRLAYVVTCVEDLRRHAQPDRIGSDPVQGRFIEHTLQLAIQAMLDAASGIVSGERLGEPRTNHELFDLLARGGWIPTDHVERYRRIVGFRNVLVHQYLQVDPEIVREVVTGQLDDLLAFVSSVRGKLDTA